MLNSITHKLFAAVAMAVVLTGWTFAQGFGPGPGTGPGQAPARWTGGNRTGNGTCCLSSGTQSLTDSEKAWLIFMRQEEKLARDVYTKLYSQWKLRIFSNIARGEERHFNSIGVLLETYGIDDPVKNLVPGSFADPDLAALYNQLLTKGMTSLRDALEVGQAIENDDIEDLETALKETKQIPVKTVYSNLLDGSLNHLEAFESMLELIGSN